MRPTWDARNLAGALALAATLLLSGPGVTVVRAEEPPLASPAPPAPVCSVDAPAAGPVELDDRGRQVLRLRTKPPQAEPVVVLNTRGYGYGPAPGTDLESIRRGLLSIHRESR